MSKNTPSEVAVEQSSYTRGPWTVVEYGDGDSLAIHDGDSANRICFMATHGSSRKQWDAIQANARLIAAAPDLLEALQAYHEHFGVLEDNHMLHEDARRCAKLARAAISKATTP